MQPTASNPLPVIVDTDTASDDAQALALAARSPRLDVRAVTVVGGNVSFDAQVANALHTLELAGCDAPVYPGARRPLAKEYDYATGVHGERGLGRATADPSRTAEDRYAVDALVDRLREQPGEIGLIGIGPWTNLAEALRREPALGELAAGVWLMGGAVDTRGNVTPAAEYNAWVDPDAARLVCRELDATLIDWGLSRETALPAERLDRIAESDAPLADFFTDATANARARARSRGTDRLAQPDALAVAVAAYPELVQATADYRIEVDAREGPTRGYTLAREPTDDGEHDEGDEVGAENHDGRDEVGVDEHDETDEVGADEHDEAETAGTHALTTVVDRVDTAVFHDLLTETLLDGRPSPP